MKRTLLPAIGIWLAALVPVRAGAPSDPGLSAAASPPQAVAAYRSKLQAEVRLDGWLTSRQRQRLHVPALEGQRLWTVTWLAVEGDPIAAGQSVVRFDPARAETRLARAEHRVQLARLQLARQEAERNSDRLELEWTADRADLELERARLLAMRGVGLVPELQAQQARLDQRTAGLRAKVAREALAGFDRSAQAELEVYRLALARAERRVDQARQAVARLTVTAPTAGLVRLLPVATAAGRQLPAPGMVVQAGEALAEVLDPVDLVARIPIQPDPATAFRPDDQVELVVPALGGARVAGRVLGVVSGCRSAWPATGRGCPLELWIAPRAGRTRLRPELGVQLELRLTVADQALVVPTQAVLVQDGGPMVWCPQAKPAGWRPVVLGRRTPELVEVLEGLVEGERVSLDPARSAGLVPPPATQPIESGGTP